MQESSYQLNAKGCHIGRNTKTFTIDEVCSDFGMPQIYVKTAISYKFDIDLLLTDLEYSVAAGAEVLAYFQKTYANKEPKMWYTRYNCGTKSNVYRQTCKTYKQLVKRYF
jgi:hypothetical protein